MATMEEHQPSFLFPQALTADHAPPTLDILSNFMSEIDQELAKQDKKIEETLEKLVEATNSLSSDNMYTNIKDAMDSLVHTSVLEECACLPPDSEDVNKLLKIIIEHISSHPGSEGVVFQQLLHISFHEGMTLPVRAPKVENVATSSLSLNTISDTMEIENDSLWEDLRGRIRKYFFEQIQSIGSDEVYGTPTRRVKLLQSICVLYPVGEVWHGYKSLRSNQIHQIIRQRLQNIPEETLAEAAPTSVTLSEVSERLPGLFASLKHFMEEDFNLFMVGIFGQEVDLKTALWNIYISKLNDELQGMFDAIASKKMEAGKIANGHPASPTPALPEVLSQTSFDESHKPLAPFLLSDEEVKMVLTVAAIVSSLNNFYKSLCYQASWDTSIAFKLPAKGKGLLKGVLKPSRDTNNSHLASLHDFKQRGVLPDAIPPPFGATPSMISDSSQSIPYSDIVVETPIAQRNKWNWFYLLEKFIPGLVDSFLSQMRESLLTKISVEDSVWHDQNCLSSTPLVLVGDDQDLFADFHACPITESTLHLILSLTQLAPLESLWTELPMRYFKTVLASNSKECLQLLHSHLSKKLEDFVIQRASSNVVTNVKELYIILASASAILEWIRGSDFWSSEEDSGIKSCSSAEEQFEELQTMLVKEIEEYHNHLIQFVILQDAASHHWEDQKPFFEGERCSFSIQMWDLHMERLRGELWTSCPPGEATSIFGGILGRSLQFLSRRYSRAKPSYKRTKQLRCDILSILSSTLEHLFAATDSIQEVLLMSSIQAHPMSHIHSPCTNLLSPLAVVTSPLPDLYKIFKKGFGQRQRFREDKDPDPSWMGWIWPELFERFQSLSDMPDSSAVFLAVNLIKKQPTYNYPLLLQSLLMRNSLLPSLMAREIGKSRTNVPRYDGAPVHFEEYTEDERKLFMTLTSLLAVCSDFPKSLGSFLLSLVEREYSYSGNKVQESLYLDKAPLWMECILKLLSPCFVRCLTEVAGQLEVDPSQDTNPPGFLEDLRQLPCGCRIRSKGQMLQKKDPDKVLLHACKVFMSALSSEVLSLPISFSIFVQNLEKLLPDDGSNKEHSLGLKLLVQILLLFLRDEVTVKGHLHKGLPDSIFKRLCQIGRLACMLLLGQTLDDLDAPQSLYHEFLRQYGDWQKDCISSLTEHFRRKETAQHQDPVLEGTMLDYQEEYYRMLFHSVSSYPDVMSNLPTVYNAVADNVEWIRSIMEIPPMPLFKTSEQTVSFEFRSTDDTGGRRFNPVQQVNKIGDNPFTFENLSELALDWKELLQSEIGLTKTSFQLLLSHRHDMQEEAYLEESEKKPVRVLRAKYNLDRADFV